MTKLKFKKILPYLLAVFLLILFIFLRFYKITNSLLFFNDIGRDFLALWNWQHSNKPPLLGPQTSAIPFNQSAVYFYLLYPFYLISNGSPYATLIALAVFYITAFVLGLYLLRKYPRWRNSLLIVFFLICLHPQYIIQNRFVWNPSFVSPFLLFAFYAFLSLRRKYLEEKSLNKVLSWGFALALALAVSFSYSVFPVFLSFALMTAFVFKKDFWPLAFKTVASLTLVNLPTIVFELRHNFLLTNMMLTREAMPQPASYLMAKLEAIASFVFHLPNVFYLAIFLILLILLSYLMNKRKKLSFELLLALALFFLTLAITLLMPVAIQAHYIFGLTTCLFLVLAFLIINNRWALLILPFLLIFWLKPTQLASYFAPAYRSVDDSLACARNFCKSHQQPLFVAVQSDFHPYHNAMEWQYLFLHSDCELKDLVTNTADAEYLAVVVEKSQYDHNKTAFNELTIFGPSEEVETFVCQDDLEIRLLKKISPL